MPSRESGGTSARRTVSLIIPVRNEAEHIERCLESVRSQTYPAELIEVIVVDGDSTDETRAIVRRVADHDPRIRLLDNPKRSGPHGLNIGLAAATGRYIGYIVGHSRIPPDYVLRVTETLEQTGAWCVGVRIVRIASTPMQRAIAVATASRIGVGDSRHNYSGHAGWAETAFPGFWPREVFDRVGPIDPAMVANEDNELSHRIRRAGGGVWYEPSIGVVYVPRASLGALFDQYRRYALGKVLVMRKHRGGLRWRHLIPPAWVAFLSGGVAVSVLWPPFVWAWLTGIATYVAAVAIASIRLQMASGVGWHLIAAALATLHAAYGLGVWQGILGWRRRW